MPIILQKIYVSSICGDGDAEIANMTLSMQHQILGEPLGDQYRSVISLDHEIAKRCSTSILIQLRWQSYIFRKKSEESINCIYFWYFDTIVHFWCIFAASNVCRCALNCLTRFQNFRMRKWHPTIVYLVVMSLSEGMWNSQYSEHRYPTVVGDIPVNH